MIYSPLYITVRYWDSELRKRKTEYKPSLAKSIARCFGPYYLSLGIYIFIEECVIRVFQPLFMGKTTENQNVGQTVVVLQAG